MSATHAFKTKKEIFMEILFILLVLLILQAFKGNKLHGCASIRFVNGTPLDYSSDDEQKKVFFKSSLINKRHDFRALRASSTKWQTQILKTNSMFITRAYMDDT